MAQAVKNLPAMQETQVQSLGWADPLEEGMATHSSILAWRIPWTEEPGELQSMELHRIDTTKRTKQTCRAGKELWGKNTSSRKADRRTCYFRQ